MGSLRGREAGERSEADRRPSSGEEKDEDATEVGGEGTYGGRRFGGTSLGSSCDVWNPEVAEETGSKQRRDGEDRVQRRLCSVPAMPPLSERGVQREPGLHLVQ